MKNCIVSSCAIGAALLASTQTSFGAITGVVQSGGDADRPSARFTGEVFDISNPGVLVAGYTVPTFGEDAKVFTDRVHEWNSASATVALPSYLVGGSYIMSANNNRDNALFRLDVTVSVPSFIYLLIDNRINDSNAANPPNIGPGTGKMEWVSVANGWSKVSTGLNRTGDLALPDEVGVDENANVSIENWSSVFVKQVGVGTEQLLELNEAGRNMYGVVVTPTPEPGTWTLLGLGAGLIVFASWRRR